MAPKGPRSRQPSVIEGASVDLPAVGSDSTFDEFFEHNQEQPLGGEGARSPSAPTSQTTTTAPPGATGGLEGPADLIDSNLNQNGQQVNEFGEPTGPQRNVPNLSIDREAQQAAQRERELILPFSDKLGVNSFGDFAVNKDIPINAAIDRGRNLNKVLTTGSDADIRLSAGLVGKRAEHVSEGRGDAAFDLQREGVQAKREIPALKDSNISLTPASALYDPRLLNAGVYDPNTSSYSVNPEFGPVASLTYENFLHQASLGATDPNSVTDFPDENGEVTSGQEIPKITKAQGNAQLGRDGWRNWQRQKAKLDGVEPDAYLAAEENITPEAFTFMGDLIKEAYAEANPDMMFVDRPINPKAGEQVVFQPTPDGLAKINALAESKKNLFEAEEVPPLNAPSPTAQPQYDAKTLVKPVTTKVGELGDTKIVDEAMNNYHGVEVVNDPISREALSMQFGIIAIAEARTGQVGETADWLGVGAKRRAEVEGQKRKLQSDIDLAETVEARQAAQIAFNAYNVEEVINADRVKLLSGLGSLSKYTGQINHLTYAMQALTGRTHTQQTGYDPQGNPLIRFAVGGGNIFRWKAGDGSVIDRNWREIIAAKLLTDSKGNAAIDLTTEARLKLLQEKLKDGSLKSMIDMGYELRQNNAKFDSKEAKALMSAALSAPDPETFAKITQEMEAKFGTNPLSGKVKTELSAHGKEALAHAEALMDLSRYSDALNSKGGVQMFSNLSPEMDGKMHGPGTNGALLGVKEIAYRVGLLREQDYHLTDKIDARKEMGRYMMESVGSRSGTLYPNEQHLAYNALIAAAVQDRPNYLKKSPMTMGYGQSLGALKQHVQATFFTGERASELQAIAKEGGIADADAITFLHSMLVDSIFHVFDPKVVAVGRLLKANGLASILTNTPLWFNNAMGMKSYAAAMQTDEALTRSIPYSFQDKHGSKKGLSRSAQLYGSTAQGSALRTYKEGDAPVPGGYTMGRVSAVAVQSYDGNMVAKTGSGSSWDRISKMAKARGAKPFVIPIFDAFKVDLGSFDTVRQEANRNWVEGLKNHSYVTSIMEEWYEGMKAELVAKRKELDPLATVSTGERSEYRGIGYLFNEVDKSGDPMLLSTLSSVIEFRPKRSNEKIDAYQKAIKANAAQSLKNIYSGMNANDIPTKFTQLTNAQIATLINIVLNEVKLSGRNSSTVRTIKADKDKLFKEIAATNRGASQVDLA